MKEFSFPSSKYMGPHVSPFAIQRPVTGTIHSRNFPRIALQRQLLVVSTGVDPSPIFFCHKLSCCNLWIATAYLVALPIKKLFTATSMYYLRRPAITGIQKQFVNQILLNSLRDKAHFNSQNFTTKFGKSSSGSSQIDSNVLKPVPAGRYNPFL